MNNFGSDYAWVFLTLSAGVALAPPLLPRPCPLPACWGVLSHFSLVLAEPFGPWLTLTHAVSERKVRAPLWEKRLLKTVSKNLRERHYYYYQLWTAPRLKDSDLERGRFHRRNLNILTRCFKICPLHEWTRFNFSLHIITSPHTLITLALIIVTNWNLISPSR